MPVFNTNSADPDRTLHSAASDLGLHCLQMSDLWDARHKWVNFKRWQRTAEDKHGQKRVQKLSVVPQQP